MTRHSRSGALPTRFTTTPGAAATAAVFLGVLMTLSGAGLTRAKMPPTPDPSSSSSVPPSSPQVAFSNTVPSSSVTPTSPMLSFNDHSPAHSNPPPSMTDAGSSKDTFSAGSFTHSDDSKPGSFTGGSNPQSPSVLYSQSTTSPGLDHDHDHGHPDSSSSSGSTASPSSTLPSQHKRSLNAKAAHRRFHQGTTHARHGVSRQTSNKTYNLVDSYEGTSFFDGWDFFDSADPTHGMVTFVTADEASSSNLAYVQNDGVAVMTVDTKTTLSPGAYRKSVRITSKKTYEKALFVFDILRARKSTPAPTLCALLTSDPKSLAHACSAWPAAWIVGDNWPAGGEIDVIEGVHENQYNQMTLHTSPGCSLDTAKSLADGVALAAGLNPIQMFTGTVLESDCDATVNSNAGCGVLDDDTRSYGAGLNSNGGGVYATLWNDDGVRIWFFPRESVPTDITGKTPDPSTWGSPKAFWAADTCSSSFFSNLSIVFDIVLGGDWAGATFNAAGCPGTLEDYVADPTNFSNANWAVNYVRVYQ